jgi:hypothetical protein
MRYASKDDVQEQVIDHLLSKVFSEKVSLPSIVHVEVGGIFNDPKHGYSIGEDLACSL